ncbi:thrombospondin type 1 domain protein, partial [Oesophagostomum dentatum]
LKEISIYSLVSRFSINFLPVCLGYSVGGGVQATGCTTCTLPPASNPCSTCQTPAAAPPIVLTPHWSEWGAYGQCTVSCGGGQQMRQRMCDTGNSCSNCYCVGSATEIQACNTAACPAACTTCQSAPHYDPVTYPPCTTCGNPVTTVATAPCSTCGASVPYIQQSSPCNTCGTGYLYYNPYRIIIRRKRSENSKKPNSLMDHLLKR